MPTWQSIKAVFLPYPEMRMHDRMLPSAEGNGVGAEHRQVKEPALLREVLSFGQLTKSVESQVLSMTTDRLESLQRAAALLVLMILAGQR